MHNLFFAHFALNVEIAQILNFCSTKFQYAWKLKKSSDSNQHRNYLNYLDLNNFSLLSLARRMKKQQNKAETSFFKSLERCSVLQWHESSSLWTRLYTTANPSLEGCLIYVAKSWNRTKAFFEITLIALIKIAKSFSKPGAEKGKNFNTCMEKELLCTTCHS